MKPLSIILLPVSVIFLIGCSSNSVPVAKGKPAPEKASEMPKDSSKKANSDGKAVTPKDVEKPSAPPVIEKLVSPTKDDAKAKADEIIRMQVRELLASHRGEGAQEPVSQRLKRMNSLTKVDLDAWANELKVSRDQSLGYLMALKPAYANDVIEPGASAKYLKRVVAVPPGARSAFAAVVAPPVDDLAAAVLVAQLPVFDQEQFQPALFDVALDEAKKAKK